MTAATTEIFQIGPGLGPAAGAQEMGFKAYNLARVARLGLPVPPAFVLGTGFCSEFFSHARTLPPGTRELLAAQVRYLESASGLAFGSERRPLLVSVRSGAPVSMPGMMQTVLDVGLTDSTSRGLLRMTGNPRLVWDSYRRLVQAYAEVVHGCKAERFRAVLDRHVQAAGLERSQDLDFHSLAKVTREYLGLFERLTGRPFPQDPMDQLEGAVGAVLDSWHGAKAREFRRLNGLDDTFGTAVTVQRMVFGNAGGTSGSGVLYTRDPATGENRAYLEFLFNAQGEDVVSGRHAVGSPLRLAEVLPEVHTQVQEARRMLEAEFLDAQEVEFTVENGTLFLLQTRTAKRTPSAALRMAVESVRDGLIDPATALERLGEYDLEAIREVRLDPNAGGRRLCRAEPASSGVASGAIALDAAAAIEAARAGSDIILVREETSTDDIAGVAVARGILTALGGRTSHAAVVARHLDKVCLVGCSELAIDLANRRCSIAGEWLDEGDTICLDGNTGGVWLGTPRVVVERPTAYLAEVARWRELVH